MSLHLGSSKYDEHTVRKVISKRYFKYLHPLCSICFPGHRAHASLEDKARATPGPAALSSARPPLATTPSHCGGAVLPAQHRSPRQHPRLAPSRSRRESAGVPLESGAARGRGCCLLRGGTVLTASAGKAQAESSPLSTVTPKTSAKPLVHLSPWILRLFTRPAHFH